MKHIFNFHPTIKYRSAYDFTTTSILFLIYSIILIKISLILYVYYNHQSLIKFLEENAILLETIARNSNKYKSFSNISSEEVTEKELKLYKFYELYNYINFPWNSLFSELESILPNNLKIIKISIRPQNLTKIYIEGIAQNIEDITLLLGNLYNSKFFIKPKLIRHTKHNADSDTNNKAINFLMETSYKIDGIIDFGEN